MVLVHYFSLNIFIVITYFYIYVDDFFFHNLVDKSRMKRLILFYILRVSPFHKCYHLPQCKYQFWKIFSIMIRYRWIDFYKILMEIWNNINNFNYPYLTGDADGLIVGPGLILLSKEWPRWTIGCWTGGGYSGFELFVPVFRSTPTITSTGLAEPIFWSFV